jgi:hypothetical protein
MGKLGKQRACLFCGVDLKGVRSQEHVFPQWLLDELDVRAKKISAVHVFQPEGEDKDAEVLSTRPLTYENLREGRICAKCNNGWMSDLEQGCQGILRDMMHSRRLPEQLSEKECLLVARWAVKTAFVVNSSANYTIKVPEQQLKQLRERSDDLPWGIVVVATTSSFFNSGWMQSTRWQLCAPDNLTKRIASLMDTRTYKIAIQFGHMVLVVVWHAIPGWWMMLWTDHHTVLWPWRGKCGWHNDDISNLGKLTPDMVLPLHMNEIKLVHPRYLAPESAIYR